LSILEGRNWKVQQSPVPNKGYKKWQVNYIIGGSVARPATGGIGLQRTTTQTTTIYSLNR